MKLTRDGVTTGALVHVLVLEAFVSPRPSGMDGCHIDGNPENNALPNLRWATHKDNMKDMVLHGRSNRGERNWNARLTEAQARDIKQHLGMGMKRRAVAERLGFDFTLVDGIARERAWAWLGE